MQDKTKVLLRSAKEVKHFRFLMRMLPAVGGGLAALAMVLYVVALMYTRYGAFSALVNKFDNVDYLLSLSVTPDFETPTSYLNAKAAVNITNISVDNLPDDLNRINGLYRDDKHKNLLAYTFYLKNVGTKPLSYQYVCYILNSTHNVEKAIRVRLYVNDEYADENGERAYGNEYTDYARTRTDGGGPEPGTKEFLTISDVAQDRKIDFGVGQITKFTVVIWIEGDDPDCNDDLIGGQFKIDMKFSILGQN